MIIDRAFPSLFTTWKEISPLRSSATAGFSGKKGTLDLDGCSESDVVPFVVGASSGLGDSVLRRLLCPFVSPLSWSSALRLEAEMELSVIAWQEKRVYVRECDIWRVEVLIALIVPTH